MVHVVYGDAPLKGLALNGEDGARERQAKGLLCELVGHAVFVLIVLYGHGIVVEANDLVNNTVTNAVGFYGHASLKLKADV